MVGCGGGELRAGAPGRENKQKIVRVDDAVTVDIGVSVVCVPRCDDCENLVYADFTIAIDIGAWSAVVRTRSIVTQVCAVGRQACGFMDRDAYPCNTAGADDSRFGFV